ncbi:hypothetical protein, partial [Vibrio parahaemolyticus]|uniref:hypothetical protein n=1 Tax=Vibrio parahaemolyticus TaxID=670 RepID=UPI001E4CA56F
MLNCPFLSNPADTINTGYARTTDNKIKITFGDSIVFFNNMREVRYMTRAKIIPDLDAINIVGITYINTCFALHSFETKS